MDANFDIKLYRERWKAVEEIERQGIARHNPIARLLIGLGIKPDNDVDQMQIILRWAKLKDLYEQGKLSRPR
jgi:hypothetical protein